MQAPHLVPRSAPSSLCSYDTLQDVGYVPPVTPKWSPFANGKRTFNREVKSMFPSLLTRRTARQTLPESSSECDAPAIPTRKARSWLGSGSETSSGFWSPRSGSRMEIDLPSTNTSMSSQSSTSGGFLSKWKKGITSKHKKHYRIVPPLQFHHSAEDVRYQSDGGHHRATHSPSMLPKLSLQQLRESETALELLQRHINFDDEFCIARTGISFDTIRPSCENQVVTVEFHTVNTWVDRTNYSQVTDPQSIVQDPFNDISDDVTSDSSGEVFNGSLDTEPIVAKLVTTLCFVPGPEMDPESAIYGDEDHVHTEPQSLADCRVGLTYFQWQETMTFQGHLYYLTERNHWKEAWFCIVGSKLWQCRRAPTASSSSSSSSQELMVDIHPMEKQKYLDLESVRYIETGTQVLKATARYLDDDDSSGFCHDMDGMESFEEFSPVKHSFRLKMLVSDLTSPRKTMAQDFYASSGDLMQAWVQSLRAACRNRPPRPYWLRKGE